MARIVRVDVVVHEGQQLLAQGEHLGAEFEFHDDPC